MRPTNTINGISVKIAVKKPVRNSCPMNELRIFRSVWPATKFAQIRSPRLTDRAI